MSAGKNKKHVMVCEGPQNLGSLPLYRKTIDNTAKIAYHTCGAPLALLIMLYAAFVCSVGRKASKGSHHKNSKNAIMWSQHTCR